MKNIIVPIFVPHSGCPNQCVFCNQKSISGVQKEITPTEVEDTICTFLENIKDDREKLNIEIAFFGGSFTGIDIEKQKELLEIANKFVKKGQVDSIRISTRPDYIDQKRLKLLKKYNVKTIELGVQSMDNGVLKISSRGHTKEDVIMAAELIKENGFILGLQMMIGLPGSDYEKEIETCKEFIKLKPKIVRIYPTLVINGTELERWYLQGKYAPLTLDEAINISKEILKLFENNDILVIRLGLQATDNISIGQDVIVGPFHPAFKELVKSEIRYQTLSKVLGMISVLNEEALEIRVNTKEVSITAGHKKNNIEKLCKEFRVREIRILGHNNVKTGQVIIRASNITVCLEDNYLC